MALSYQSDGNEKKELLMKALEYLEQCHYPGIPVNRHLAGCYNSLSLHTLEQDERDFEMANIYAEKAFKAVFPNGHNPSVLLGNYLRSLGQAGNYLKARQIFEQYQAHFKKNSNYLIILTAYLESEATYGDTERAMDMISEISTYKSINYFTYKLILITIYLRNSMLDIAQNEINNTIQSGKENNIGRDTQNMLFLVRTLIKTRMSASPKSKDLKNLKSYLTAISPEMSILIRRSILFTWYHNEATKTLEKNGALMQPDANDN